MAKNPSGVFTALLCAWFGLGDAQGGRSTRLAIRRAVAIAIATLSCSMAIGCGSTSPDGFPEVEGAEPLSAGLRKGLGGVVGQSDYCNNPDALCTAGEGDCDSTAQCAAGLTCLSNNGALFFQPATDEACVPTHCGNKVRG